MAPVTILLKGVDALTYGLAKIGVLEKGTNLEESFSGGIAGLIFDPEGAKTEADKTEKEVTDGLRKLKNTRDGYILQGKDQAKKAGDDAAAKNKEEADKRIQTEKELLAELSRLQAENITDKQARALALLELERQQKRAELEEKKASNELLLELDKNYLQKAQAIKDDFAKQEEEKKKAADEKKKAEDEKAAANKEIIDGILQQQKLDSIEDTFEKARMELEIQRTTDVEKATLAGATAEQLSAINAGYSDKAKKLAVEETKFKKALKKQEVNDALNASASVLDSVVSLVGEGSAVGKAAAVASATIQTYTSATAAYASVVGVPFVGPVLAPIAAGVAVAAGIMNVKKILSTKTPGGGGSGGGGSVPSAPAIPTAPPINPTAGIGAAAEGQNVQNQITLGNQQGASGPSVVKAYVVSSDMSKQQEADRKITDLARL